LTYYPQKWRPALWMVVALMVAIVLSLPLASLLIFRFYDSQLVRETENELIVQAAFIREMVVQRMLDEDFDANLLVTKFSESKQGDSPYKLQPPELELTTAQILEPRSDVLSQEINTLQGMKEIGAEITKVVLNAQKTTLAGFRLLDSNGIVIGGRYELGGSLADVEEVKHALKGQYKSVIRHRVSDNPKPPIYAVSRGTSIRVFIAMPIEYEGKVAGVIYLSRTPSHFLREMYQQRWKLLGVVGFIVIIAFILTYIFIRTIKNPIDALNARTVRIKQGDKTALEPLRRHGTREIADLSSGLLNMSRQLQERAEYLQTFATHVSHELKSPLTSIHGAAELLHDSSKEIDEKQQRRFLDNILQDTDRLTMLVNRLRDLAVAENTELGGQCDLSKVLVGLKNKYSKNSFLIPENLNYKIMMSEENLDIVLSNLIENSISHGANEILFTSGYLLHHINLQVLDNGSGISPSNAEKIFDVFFTTRRETGGTGMGLGIVKALLNAHDGDIKLVPSDDGACFSLKLPVNTQD